MTNVLPLSGVTVLDFSTLLPGPLATLMLAEAGARVIKIERPGGDEMRQFPPVVGETSAAFAALNGGKESIVLDLKRRDAVDFVLQLAQGADVLVEQFRPGVMDRLGLGYGPLSEINPRLIYCSITGYGQYGPLAMKAGHDINYQALSGALSQFVEEGGAAPLPPPLVADIAGGAYPAVMNILLALRQREATLRGQHLDIAMAAGAASFAWYGRAHLSAYGHAPHGGETLLTGASPRYRLYATSDGWFVAVGALEDKFWRVFCDAIGLADALRGRDAMASGVIRIVADEIASKPAAHWRSVLEPIDCCCTVVRTLEEAESFGPRYEAMTQTQGGLKTPLAVLPIVPELRKPQIAPRAVPPLKPATG